MSLKDEAKCQNLQEEDERPFLLDIVEAKCKNKQSWFTLEELDYIYGLCQMLRKTSAHFEKYREQFNKNV